MTLDDSYQQHQGTAILVPGGGARNNGQCAQWADTVYHDVYGLPYIYTPAAKDWWYNADALGITQHFDKITDGSIKKGDFVVWNPLSLTDPEGHIDVASRDGNSSDFYAYDSNWDATHFHDTEGYPILHEVHHADNFNKFIIGVLRPKGATMIPLTQSNKDKLIKMAKRAEPTANELSDPTYDDANRAINDFWVAWGATNYAKDQTPWLTTGDIDNLLKSWGITPTQADYDALKLSQKDFVYWLSVRLKDAPAQGFTPVKEQLYTKN